MTRTLDEESPIVLGLFGVAGSGKTITGYGLCKDTQPANDASDVYVPSSIVWNHLYFALPLYEMAAIKRKTEGYMSADRIKYQIHDILLSLFGSSPLFGAPSYDQLIDLVNEIYDFPVPKEGKPRTFLQKVGTDMCRVVRDDCFTFWMGNKINEDYEHFYNSYGEFDNRPPWGTVLTDSRFINEAEFVRKQQNYVLLKLTASPEVLSDRLERRDGVRMTPEQMAHKSEQQVNEIPEEWFDEIIDTSDMTIKEQVEYVNDLVEKRL